MLGRQILGSMRLGATLPYRAKSAVGTARAADRLTETDQKAVEPPAMLGRQPRFKDPVRLLGGSGIDIAQ